MRKGRDTSLRNGYSRKGNQEIKCTDVNHDAGQHEMIQLSHGILHLSTRRVDEIR
jgi:hypothetical protein